MTRRPAELKAGDILDNYPYLWLRQKRAGETEGRKSRPVCIAIAVASGDGNTHLALLAISSQAPKANQVAIAVPELERRRIGLEDKRDAWVYLSEYNYDVLEESFYLKRNRRVTKSVSAPFLKELLLEFKNTLSLKTGRISRL